MPEWKVPIPEEIREEVARLVPLMERSRLIVQGKLRIEDSIIMNGDQTMSAGENRPSSSRAMNPQSEWERIPMRVGKTEVTIVTNKWDNANPANWVDIEEDVMHQVFMQLEAQRKAAQQAKPSK